jgi:Sulfotransferase family
MIVPMPHPMPVIVGIPRSGTTLLRMMIDAHPAVAVPPETGFLPALADLDPSTDVARAAWEIITGFHT